MPKATDDGHHFLSPGELRRLPARGACEGTRQARPIALRRHVKASPNLLASVGNRAARLPRRGRGQQACAGSRGPPRAAAALPARAPRGAASALCLCLGLILTSSGGVKNNRIFKRKGGKRECLALLLLPAVRASVVAAAATFPPPGNYAALR